MRWIGFTHAFGYAHSIYKHTKRLYMWMYIYGPVLVSVCFEDTVGSSQYRLK